MVGSKFSTERNAITMIETDGPEALQLLRRLEVEVAAIRRELFLNETDQVVPWKRLLALIEPHYPLTGGRRRTRRPARLDSLHARTSPAIHVAGRMDTRTGKSGLHATVSSTVRPASPSSSPTASALMARSSNGTEPFSSDIDDFAPQDGHCPELDTCSIDRVA